jgi:site-specific DNA recombinase
MANPPKQKKTTLAEEPRDPTSRGTSAVGLYMRVSTDRQAQEGDSLEEQESELRKYCEYHTLTIRKVYIERGKSGGNTNRPEYQKMIQDIEAHTIDTVVVKKLDRLSRSLLDFEQLMTKMQAHNVEFVSIKEQFETISPMGKAMLRIALVFAQLEREQTSERTSDVLRYRAKLGLYNGGVTPFGYISANKELVISKKEKEVVELIYTHFLKTHSTSAVSAYLHDAKLPAPGKAGWVEARVQDILQNPVYKGCIRWKNEVYPGLHTPIIAPSIWEQVQLIFESKQRILAQTRSNALLQKLAVCRDCHHPLLPSFAYNRTKTKYGYYRCGSTTHGKHRRLGINCTFKYVASIKLHNDLSQAIGQLATPHHISALDHQVMAHNQTLELQIKTLTDTISLAESELKQIKAKKSEYVDFLVIKTPSAQDRGHINERIQELNAETKQLQAQLASAKLEVSQLQDKILTVDSLKQAVLVLRDMDQTNPEYRQLLHDILTRVQVSSSSLIFHFKAIPWAVEIPLNSL